jgi:aminomethyltransferase
MTPPATTPARTPLHDRHLALGAKTGDFGGWDMPLDYSGGGGGVLREHTAVRESVGVFDVSHLGKGVVRGPGAAAHVNACLTNDLGRIGPGQAQYTVCCADDGGVVDDLIVYLRGDDEVFLIPNAANSAEVLRRLADEAPDGVEVEDLHSRLAVLAVQGPRSDELLAAVGIEAPEAYMSFGTAGWSGRQVVVCRSGYTGERGVELLPRWDDAGELWDALLAAADDLGGRACGLGARDTLRTEMGYPLHGHDLSLDITPVQARLGWAVGWDKPTFWGAEALRAEKEAGPRRRLEGVEVLGRGIPRQGAAVVGPDGARIGEVTSGTFSPTRQLGIGLALIDTAAGLSPGDEAALDVRGRTVPVRVVRPPFVESSPR